ncbi:MAG: hypothetical protein IJB09_05560 [Oscillospiraceae bacterium]|nr:hypothetical protein [Oscillospiraceae bacterium]
MILALAVRHRAERPAISMEGGAILMERACRPPFGLPMKTSEISFHGEIYFIWTAAEYLAAAKGLIENKSCEK